MTKDRIKKIIAWIMLVGGVSGAFLSMQGLVAPSEPQWILQLSWAAVWVTGVVGVIAADDSGLSDEDVERIARRVVAVMKESG